MMRWAANMKRNTITRFAVCAAVAVAADSALPLLAADLPGSVSNVVETWPAYRFMQYNIAYCRHATNETQTVEQGYELTAAAIATQSPDFVTLNEVSFSGSYDGGRNQAELIAAATGLTVAGYTPGIKYGNAILSKTAPLSSETVTLPMSTEGWGTRYCTICEFTNFYVAVTHLDTVRSGCDNTLVQASNAVAIATVRAKFAEYTKPVFLCGDWNTHPNWDNMALVNEFMTILSPTNGVRTYQGNKATGGSILDYIAVDTADVSNFYVKAAHVTEDILTSDHNPVVVDVAMIPSAAELGWVNENAITTLRTGAWSKPVAYEATMRKAEIKDATFTPTSASNGRSVTMTVTAEMSAANEEQADPDSTAQAAIRLGTNGCFQVWTLGGSQSSATAQWVDVAADGVTPTNGVEYTFRVTFDYKAQTYSVELLDGAGASRSCATVVATNAALPAGATAFPLATSATAISTIRFKGDGVFTSLTGEYVAVEGFSEAETVLLKDNASVILDAAKAAWLNSCAGGKTAVGSAAAGLSAQEFSDAYLLNLDITDGDRSYSFEITDVDVGAENVTVAVTLTRSGNIAQSVNGVLKFYGAATLEAFKSPTLQPLSSETVSDDDFSDGNTATATYPKVSGTTTNTFFKAKIEER